MLEKELKVFNKHIDEWLKTKAGYFVLIKDKNVIGFYPKIEEALTEGASRFGHEHFLVKKIDKKVEEVYIPTLSVGITHA